MLSCNLVVTSCLLLCTPIILFLMTLIWTHLDSRKIKGNWVPTFKRNGCWHRLWSWDTTLRGCYQMGRIRLWRFCWITTQMYIDIVYFFFFSLFQSQIWIDRYFFCVATNYLPDEHICFSWLLQPAYHLNGISWSFLLVFLFITLADD